MTGPENRRYRPGGSFSQIISSERGSSAAVPSITTLSHTKEVTEDELEESPIGSLIPLKILDIDTLRNAIDGI